MEIATAPCHRRSVSPPAADGTIQIVVEGENIERGAVLTADEANITAVQDATDPNVWTLTVDATWPARPHLLRVENPAAPRQPPTPYGRLIRAWALACEELVRRRIEYRRRRLRQDPNFGSPRNLRASDLQVTAHEMPVQARRVCGMTLPKQRDAR
jgi:hypothetical protein